jgi:hypothetical protein
VSHKQVCARTVVSPTLPYLLAHLKYLESSVATSRPTISTDFQPCLVRSRGAMLSWDIPLRCFRPTQPNRFQVGIYYAVTQNTSQSSAVLSTEIRLKATHVVSHRQQAGLHCIHYMSDVTRL